MTKSQPSNHFPTRLHDMLDDAQKKGHSHVVSWCTDGTSFKIHDPTAMVPILKNYFRQTKYKSLLRQLQGYCFKRVTNGESRGTVSHPQFVRGKRSESFKIKRKSVKSPSTSLSSLSSITRTQSFADYPASSSSNCIPTKQANSNVMNQFPSGTATSLPVILQGSSQIDAKTLMKLPQTLPSCAMSKFQHKQIVSSPSPSCGKIIRKTSIANRGDMKQLEMSYQMVQNQELEQNQQFHTNPKAYTSSTTQDSSAGHHRGCEQQKESQGLYPLSVKVGCTFSTSSTKDDEKKNPNPSMIKPSTLKRSLPSHQGFVSKHVTQQSQQLNCHYQKEEDIPVEDKIQSQYHQDSQRKQNQPYDLEKLVQFPPQEIMPFHFSSQQQNLHQLEQERSQTVDYSVGTLDVDITLTTTTRSNAQHPFGKSSGVTTHVCNDFVFPAEFKPTPFSISLDDSTCQRTNTNDGTRGNMAITPRISPATGPEAANSNNCNTFEKCTSNCPPKAETVRETADVELSLSDTIDLGIVEAFDYDDGSTKDSDNSDRLSGDKSNPFESDGEKQDGDGVDKWTRRVESIVYNGTLDCVLEPEKFQLEVTRLPLNNVKKPQSQSHQHQFLLLQQQQMPTTMHHHQGRKAHQVARHAPAPQRPTITAYQQQMQKYSEMDGLFPIPSTPSLFHNPHFFSTTI